MVDPLVEGGSEQHKALYVAFSAAAVGAGRNVVNGSRYKVAAPAIKAAERKGLLVESHRNTETGAPTYVLTDAGRAEALRLGKWFAS